MAITTRDEAVSNYEKKRNAAKEALIRLIEERISNNFVPGYELEIEIKGDLQMAVEEVVERYREVGWNVIHRRGPEVVLKFK